MVIFPPWLQDYFDIFWSDMVASLTVVVATHNILIPKTIVLRTCDFEISLLLYRSIMYRWQEVKERAQHQTILDHRILGVHRALNTTAAVILLQTIHWVADTVHHSSYAFLNECPPTMWSCKCSAVSLSCSAMLLCLYLCCAVLCCAALLCFNPK